MTVQSLPEIAAPRDWTRPTRASFAVFAAKAALLRARRGAIDLVQGPARLARVQAGAFSAVAGAARSSLWSDEDVAERALQQGKVQNLRVAARALDGLVLPAGAVFSFWRHVGAPVRIRGFVPGRMLQQGCMVEAVGGGLCQLSNALYEAALQSGCRIVERHAHSSIVPGSAAALGRDATVAWNYVDLRFASERELRLGVRLDRDSLTVEFRAREAPTESPQPAGAETSAAPSRRIASGCGSCDETDCFLHQPADPGSPSSSGRQAFLVDEAWPEFRDHVRAARTGRDVLGRPLDGARLGLDRYAWDGQGFGVVRSAPLAALRRAAAQRVAGLQDAARRTAELEAARRIAAGLARALAPDMTEVTAAQSYLPFLWRQGCLGGRAVSVLMTRLPMAVLQARLDAAAAAHPDRASLADFRAPAWLTEAEAEALAAADWIITPHAEIAALFGARAVRLPWSGPAPSPAIDRPIRRIAFVGPTVARKGAFAVRDAAAALDLEVLVLGAELEKLGFWRGVRTLPAGDWRQVDAVVQPALVEEQPRWLLAALAAGLPVFASAACGLDPRPGLTLIPPDDAQALILALQSAGRSAPNED